LLTTENFGDYLSDFYTLDFNLASIHNAKFRDLKTKNISERAYQEAFALYPDSSDVSHSRRWLRDFWNKVLRTIPPNHHLWKISHPDGLLMKAMNHLLLIEPIDEAVYQKAKLWAESGSYWIDNNRPDRYDKIDKLLLENKGNTNPFSGTYIYKRRYLQHLGFQNPVDFKVVESLTFCQIIEKAKEMFGRSSTQNIGIVDTDDFVDDKNEVDIFDISNLS